MKKKPRIRIGRLLFVAAAFVLLVGGVGYGIVRYGPSLLPVISQITNNEKTAAVNTVSHEQDVKKIKNQNALDGADVSGFSDEELRQCFFSQELDEKLMERLQKMGYTDQIAADKLRYVRVLYYDFDNKPTVGELIVNADVASKIENVFFDLFLHKYQIGKMILPDAYGTRISESYADNNTVGLCFGLTEDNKGQLHASGYAIDLNPLYNPLIKDNGDSLSVFPMEGQLYLDRTVNAAHFIYAGDYAVEAFKKEGFVWKGNVKGMNDYKHFEYESAPHQTSSQSPASQEGQAEITSEQASSLMDQQQNTGPSLDDSAAQQPVQEIIEQPAGELVQDPAQTIVDPNAGAAAGTVTDPGLQQQPGIVEEPVTTPEVPIETPGYEGESPMPYDPATDGGYEETEYGF